MKIFIQVTHTMKKADTLQCKNRTHKKRISNRWRVPSTDKIQHEHLKDDWHELVLLCTYSFVANLGCLKTSNRDQSTTDQSSNWICADRSSVLCCNHVKTKEHSWAFFFFLTRQALQFCSNLCLYWNIISGRHLFKIDHIICRLSNSLIFIENHSFF